MIKIDSESESVDTFAHWELAKRISLAVTSEGLSFVLDRSRISKLLIKVGNDLS